MSAASLSSPEEAARLAAPPALPARAQTPSRLSRAIFFPVKLLWGMLFCQSFLGSILVVGWSYRLARRSAFRRWWKSAERSRSDADFIRFLGEQEETRHSTAWPNWFLQLDFAQAAHGQPRARLARRLLSLVQALSGSLWLNLRLGLQGILNTWVLTLPAGLFWWFGWYAGWNNSFNKGYEQTFPGPLICIAGILMFIAAMFYVPLAQARQAVSGEWRSFYSFRVVWTILRERWLSCVGLAGLYSALSLPLTVLKTVPMFLPQKYPFLEGLSEPEALKYLNAYFFWCALAVFPSYALLRVLAARIYASGLLASVRSGRLSPNSLSACERSFLERLDLLRVRPQPARHPFVRGMQWTGTHLGSLTARVVIVGIWFSLVAQIYISEFLSYHGAWGWLNQPLVQLPWFHYLPK